jgi:hypothetical protein
MTPDRQIHTTGSEALSILAGWSAAPVGLSTDDRWQIAAALRVAKCTDPHPAPSAIVRRGAQ